MIAVTDLHCPRLVIGILHHGHDVDGCVGTVLSSDVSPSIDHSSCVEHLVGRGIGRCSRKLQSTRLCQPFSVRVADGQHADCSDLALPLAINRERDFLLTELGVTAFAAEGC